VDVPAIVKERARVSGDLILVDDFLNHRVAPDVITAVGRDLAKRLAPFAPDVILTAEASGIPVALAAALELGLPMVYAKKYLRTGGRRSYAREVSSPTKGVEYRVEVSQRALDPGARVAIVDDFLSRGRTAEALGEIAEEAGCPVVACMFAIEKMYLSGRPRLEAHGWFVDAAVKVAAISDGSLRLDGES
jgi:xanthine phosphoribosyltransferase